MSQRAHRGIRLFLLLALVMVVSAACKKTPNPDTEASRYYEAAVVAYNSGDYELAIQGFSQAIALSPAQSQLAYIHRGNAYEQLGATDRAMQDFDQAIAVAPDSEYAYYAYQSRAMAYFKQALWEEAIADYSKTIELKPDAIVAYLMRADSYRLSGQLDRALPDADQALALDTSMAMGYAVRGNIHADRGEWAKAAEDYNQALSILAPSVARLTFAQAESAQIGNLPQVIAELEAYSTETTSSQTQITDLLERLRAYHAPTP
ncbi:MAG TPA: tetratricopeptide repeat protein [Anaerolineae bacterium]|nr:tetratricopeptide repeat protein [Anaerolineae bacterium]